MRCLHCRRGDVLPKEACRECGVSQVPLMVDMLAPGTLLHDGTYEVGHPIGRGGFGITYEATHRNLEAPVAIKEYFPSGAARAGAAGRVVPSSDTRAAHERHLKRFVAQGRVLARLSHPNVVRVQDLFQERDTAYLVMERLGGASLSEHLELRPDRLLPASEVIELGAQLTEALEAIHSQGIYHLDVKPDNLRLLPSGRLVLLDFGALRTAERGRTSTQAFTAEYAPPELLAGDEVGPESDLYELAVLLVELLTAQRPRPALERMLSHRHDLPEGLEPAWREHLRQALALRRADRPPRVGPWWRELMQAVQGGRRPAELGTSTSTARLQSDEHRPSLGSARAVLPAPQRGAAPGGRDARVLRAGSPLHEALQPTEPRASFTLGRGKHILEHHLTIEGSLQLAAEEPGAVTLVLRGATAAIEVVAGGRCVLEGLVIEVDEQGLPAAIGVQRGGWLEMSACALRQRRPVESSADPRAAFAGLRVAAGGAGALRSCTFEGHGIGLLLEGSCDLLIERPTCSRNLLAGIVCEGGYSGQIDQLRSVENKQYGVLVRQQAHPQLANAELLGNGEAGMACQGTSGGVLRASLLQGNGEHGALVLEQSQVIIEDSLLESNGSTGLCVLGTARPQARRNRLVSNGSHGAAVLERACPQLHGNELSENGEHGALLGDQASGVFEDNLLSQNGLHGIRVLGDCRLALTHNICRGNGHSGIEAGSRVTVTLRGNQLHTNGEHGLKCVDAATVVATSNACTGNTAAGICCLGSTRVTLRGNQLQGSPYGIYLADEAEIEAHDNVAEHHAAAGVAAFGRTRGLISSTHATSCDHGIYLDDETTVEVRSNHCEANTQSGVACTGQSRALIIANESTGNSGSGLLICGQAEPEVRSNRLHSNLGHGLVVTSQARPSLKQNQCFLNQEHGLLCTDEAQPSLVGNRSHDNLGCGLVYTSRATGAVHDNTFAMNKGTGVLVDDEVTIDLEGNRIVDNGLHGLKLAGRSAGTYLGNDVLGNGGSGIVIIGQACPTVERNRCSQNQEDGIVVREEAGGALRGNTSRENQRHGLLVADDASPVLGPNTFRDNLASDTMVASTRVSYEA